MKRLTNISVNIPQKNAYCYNILIGSGLLAQAEELIKKYTVASKFLVVTNETVFDLYKDKLQLKNANYVILKDGEEYKNIESYKKILDAAVENKLERKDCIVAFGGGIVGDMAGFAAACYMRGIDFVQIPTTLLAQVDSSVGGKVAINHENGKNLIGAFYQPKLVLTDVDILKTLDLRQLKTGLAEVLKYAFIEKSCACEKDFEFFEFLKKNKDKIFKLDENVITDLIKICCELKSAVVNQDETEKGLRAILNLGHTFAHATENLTDYKIFTHGEAVAMGMKSALKLSLKKGFINSNYYQMIMDLIDKYEIAKPMPDFDKEKFYEELFLDKKTQDGNIRFVLPNENFTVSITSDVSKDEIIDCLQV